MAQPDVDPSLPTVVVVDPRRGAVVPAAAVRVLTGASEIRVDPSVPTPLADALRRDLGPGTGSGGEVVVLVAGDADAPPGAALLEAVAVMDRLRSPGGCPWDAAQTHASLLRYLVEETYELHDAVTDADPAAMCEELGDVLLQVLFHARVAQEEAGAGFGIDEVATALVTKLVGRHPHVFADGEAVLTPDAQQTRWEELKAVEKRRASALDGVARAQPAAALAAKYLSRARRAGVPDDLLLGDVAGSPAPDGAGPALLALVAAAGGDAEGALRAAADGVAQRVRGAEDAARAAGVDPAALDDAGWRRFWPAAGAVT